MNNVLKLHHVLSGLAPQHQWASVVLNSLSQQQWATATPYGSCLQQLRGAKTAASDPARLVQVVLLQDIRGLGKQGEVKAANPGWVRHSLFPKRRVLYATPENVTAYAMSEEARAAIGISEEAQRAELVAMLKKLKRQCVNISRRIIPAANTAADAAGAGSAAQGNPAAQAGAAEAGKEGEAQAGKPGGMDGSVTAFDVRQCVERQLRIKLHDSHVLMEAPITSFGRYEVPLNLRLPDGEQIKLTVEVHGVKHIKHGKASV